jgi:hypothetical protein
MHQEAIDFCFLFDRAFPGTMGRRLRDEYGYSGNRPFFFMLLSNSITDTSTRMLLLLLAIHRVTQRSFRGLLYWWSQGVALSVRATEQGIAGSIPSWQITCALAGTCYNSMIRSIKETHVALCVAGGTRALAGTCYNSMIRSIKETHVALCVAGGTRALAGTCYNSMIQSIKETHVALCVAGGTRALAGTCYNSMIQSIKETHVAVCVAGGTRAIADLWCGSMIADQTDITGGALSCCCCCCCCYSLRVRRWRYPVSVCHLR